MVISKYNTCLVRDRDFMDEYEVKVLDPGEVYEFCKNYIFKDISPDEQFYVIALNCKTEIIGFSLVGQGGLVSATVEPRSVFRFAIGANAANIILIHNHPSGGSDPSEDDIAATKRLCECGEVLGIKVLDHIVYADTNYISLRASNLANFDW